MRSCGECTMCCKVMGVQELHKDANVWCDLVQIGKGCGSYEGRPPTCREFECMWLYNESVPEDLRPDKSHVVLAATLDGERIVANVDSRRPRAHETGEMGKFLMSVAQVRDVIVVVGNKRSIMTVDDKKRLSAVREIVLAARKEK